MGMEAPWHTTDTGNDGKLDEIRGSEEAHWPMILFVCVFFNCFKNLGGSAGACIRKGTVWNLKPFFCISQLMCWPFTTTTAIQLRLKAVNFAESRWSTPVGMLSGGEHLGEFGGAGRLGGAGWGVWSEAWRSKNAKPHSCITGQFGPLNGRPAVGC